MNIKTLLTIGLVVLGVCCPAWAVSEIQNAVVLSNNYRAPEGDPRRAYWDNTVNGSGLDLATDRCIHGNSIPTPLVMVTEVLADIVMLKTVGAGPAKRTSEAELSQAAHMSSTCLTSPMSLVKCGYGTTTLIPTIVAA